MANWEHFVGTLEFNLRSTCSAKADVATAVSRRKEIIAGEN